jgi:YHS domain-containing protein
MKLKIMLIICASSLYAGAQNFLNLDEKGIALQGYDPVAFFTDHMPVKGKPEFAYAYRGATYLFASKEHLAAFRSHSAKFEPAFGGYCAYGVLKGKLVEIDVNTFAIVDGRLILQYSQSVREDFNTDLHGNLRKADAQWLKLLNR